MSEFILELTNKRYSSSVNKKHKIICIGDSHIQRIHKCGKKKNLLYNNLEIYTVLSQDQVQVSYLKLQVKR